MATVTSNTVQIQILMVKGTSIIPPCQVWLCRSTQKISSLSTSLARLGPAYRGPIQISEKKRKLNLKQSCCDWMQLGYLGDKQSLQRMAPGSPVSEHPSNSSHLEMVVSTGRQDPMIAVPITVVIRLWPKKAPTSQCGHVVVAKTPGDTYIPSSQIMQ